MSVLWGSEFRAAPLDREGEGRIANFHLKGAWEEEGEYAEPDLILTFGMVREDTGYDG